MAVSRSSGRLSAPVISPSSTSVANGNGSSAKLAAMSPKVLREAFWLANGHKVRLMRVAAAIVIAGALIAIAVLIAFRWQISAATGVVYRLDRWTGHAVGAPAHCWTVSVPSPRLAVAAGRMGVRRYPAGRAKVHPHDWLLRSRR
jgi:hypothetical protein